MLSNWRTRPRPIEKSVEQVGHITGQTGKVADGETVADGLGVAENRSNVDSDVSDYVLRLSHGRAALQSAKRKLQTADDWREVQAGGKGHLRTRPFLLAGVIGGISQAGNDSPSSVHQDPRYFRLGKGSGLSRLGYAVGQIFWTHTDSGGTNFNYSEILGYSTAVGISNAYYPDNRDAASAASRLGVQPGLDMGATF
jgi:hypothetical protein